MTARKRGLAGEDIACQYLEKNGLKVLDRNWTRKNGEIDIVCKDGNVIVFVEVKSASRVSEFLPANRVNKQKQERIKQLARTYLRICRLDNPRRFDIVTVVWKGELPCVSHYRNAFH
ncbi:YraN family protein [bacterium]|nr:YraN family protein [bacterium]